MLESLKPIVNSKSRVLILGSMPGRMSLEYAQYYRHPQNRFWKIMFGFFSVPYSLDYADRIKLAEDCGFALWDSIASCTREGSLDSKIKNVKPNDIDGLIARYPNIKTVICNGRKSEQYCRKYNSVIPIYLPSTSPLNARGGCEGIWTDALKTIFD